MVGLDLDGTLLNDKKELLPYTKDVLRRAVDQGIIVLVATGRPWLGVPEELRNFSGDEIALTSNGARIIDRDENRVIEEKLLSPELARKALEYAKNMIPYRKYILTDRGMHRRIRCFMWKNIIRIRICGNIFGRQGFRLRIFSLWWRRKTGEWIKPRLFLPIWMKRAKGMERTGRRGGPGACRISEIQYRDKCPGSEQRHRTGKPGRILGIRREEIMACGDGDNDTAMMREAGFGVAMENCGRTGKAGCRLHNIRQRRRRRGKSH